MNKTIKDPVCGMDVNPEESKEKLLIAEYNGREYYFCSLFCKAAFVGNPEKYIEKENRIK